MAVLFAGHEADAFVEFTPTDLINVVPTVIDNKFDTDFSRCCLYSAGGNALRGRAAKIVIPATPEGWFGMRIRRGANTTANAIVVSGFTADDVSTLFDTISTATGSTTLRGATSDAARSAISPAFLFNDNVAYFWNIHWKAVSGGMLLEMFVDGALISTATVSNAYLNGKSVGIIRVGGVALGTPANVNSNYGWHLSEIIVTEEDCRGWRVATLAPNAAGSSSGWDGTFADIDEISADDADYISSDTANEVSLFGMTNLSVAAQNMDVKAVALSARARKGTTGPLNIQAALRSGGTDVFTSNRTGLNTSFGGLQQTIWANNPVSSAPFTVSDVQGLELGFKSIT